MKARLLLLAAGLLVRSGGPLCRGADQAPAPASLPAPRDADAAGDAAVSRAPKAKVVRDLPYVAAGHARQCLDLYLPSQSTGRLPVVVWIHGGAWQSGGKEACLHEAAWLATKGYAVAGINYRLSQHAPFPAQIEDCKAAVRWLRAHADQYGLDSDRIGAWGVSSGGHLAALLGVTGDVPALEGQDGHLDQSSRVRGVVVWYGRADLTMASGQHDSNVTAAVSQLLGAPVDAHRDLAIRASPLYYVSGCAAPFLIIHGDQDRRVPVEQGILLADALKRAGVDVTLQIVRGGGHGDHAFDRGKHWRAIETFFDQKLAERRAGFAP